MPPAETSLLWNLELDSVSLPQVGLCVACLASHLFRLKDGDIHILQLGVDYQGGAEDIYKSVNIRVEVGREW